MIFSGCQSKSKEITITEKVCPKCGETVELFNIDTEVACEKCGTVVYNDALSCVQWCRYAVQCVGAERYESLMKIAQREKARRREEWKGKE